jgi:hypothetical protein
VREHHRCGHVELRFSQRLSFDHLVLELDEAEGGFGDAADPARAGGDILQGGPALGEDFQLLPASRAELDERER